jgi:hypothetical protein
MFNSLIDATSANPNGGRFQNLMKLVRTHPSEVSASCEMDSYERFDDLIYTIPGATVVTEKLSHQFKTSNPIGFSQFDALIKDGKLGKFTFVFFGEATPEEVAQNDAYIAKVLDMVPQDYVAIFTTNALTEKIEQVAHMDIGRQILSMAEIEQTINGTTNSTYFDDEPMLVDEQVLAGLISCTILLAIFVYGFCWMSCIWGSPHIDNPFEGLQQKIAKKRN